MTDREPPPGGPSVLADEDFFIEAVPGPDRRRRRWLVWLAAAGGALAIVCFGGCLIFSLFCTYERFSTSAEVLKSSQEITDIAPPAGYEGELAEVIDTPLFLVRKAQFRHTSGKGVLLLAEVKVKYINQDDMTRQSLEKIDDDLRRINQMRHIVATEESVQSRTIRGQAVDFHVRTGEDALSTTKFHEVRGEFPGKSGPALLWLQAEDSIWDEAAANAMLDSLD